MKLLPINTQKEDSTPNNVKQIPNIYLLTTSSVLVTGIARCTKEEWNRLQKDQVLQYREGKFNIETLVKDKEKFLNKNRGIVVDNVTLEEIMVFYIKGNIYRE